MFLFQFFQKWFIFQSKIFYFDGLGAENRSFIHYYAFTSNFYSHIQDILYKVFHVNFNLKDQNANLLEYFNYLEDIQNNEDYNQIVENYNSFYNNEQCIENEFIYNYYNYYKRFKTGQEGFDIKEYEEFLEKPEVNTQIDI